MFWHDGYVDCLLAVLLYVSAVRVCVCMYHAWKCIDSIRVCQSIWRIVYVKNRAANYMHIDINVFELFSFFFIVMVHIKASSSY